MTRESVEGYLSPFGKQLEEKAASLYKERFLTCVRLAIHDEQYFVLGRIAAEMKKKVTYKVDIVVDRNGAIQECQCECAVGMGPDAHCKHVQCVLVALMTFSAGGNILTAQTCTQRLQTFHQCKHYKGSPQKASQLSLRKTDSSKGIKMMSSFDPRPVNRRNMAGYASMFSNTCINFQASSTSSVNSLPMPILQTFPPANIFGVVHDHHYLQQDPEDIFLESMGVITLSPFAIAEIEKKTRRQKEDPAWYEERRIRLTSSHFGRICKATDRTNKEKLALSFLSTKQIIAAPLQHGTKYEPIAVKKYEEMTSFDTSQCGLFVCSEHPFLASSPDRLVDINGIVEVKCPFVSKDRPITTVTVPYLKLRNDELCLDQNHDYYYQIQGQLLCTGRQFCDFVVFTLVDIKVIRIERDEDFIKPMVSELKHFYKEFFRSVLLNRFLYRNTNDYNFEY